jgi:hypothetical protein
MGIFNKKITKTLKEQAEKINTLTLEVNRLSNPIVGEYCTYANNKIYWNTFKQSDMYDDCGDKIKIRTQTYVGYEYYAWIPKNHIFFYNSIFNNIKKNIENKYKKENIKK